MTCHAVGDEINPNKIYNGLRNRAWSTCHIMLRNEDPLTIDVGLKMTITSIFYILSFSTVPNNFFRRPTICLLFCLAAKALGF